MTEVSETNLHEQSLEKRLTRVEKRLDTLIEKINSISKLDAKSNENKTKLQKNLLQKIEKLIKRNDNIKISFYYWDKEEDLQVLKLAMIFNNKSINDERTILNQINTVEMNYHPEAQVEVRLLTMCQSDAEKYFEQSEYKILAKKDD
ncbi:MAG: hypothetical protein ACTSYA_08755 [Candidatus Kariarchaeaceae archaeon]